METVLDRFSEVIQDAPGRTSVGTHEIHTETAKPIRQRPYRLPFSQRDKVKQELLKMQEMDVIQPSHSDCASPIVLVPEKNGSVRFCVDYRKLNQISRFDAYSMPRVDDIIDRLGKAKYITKIDLTRGYWQVLMSKQSRKKSAFITQFRLFEFKTMPFGLHGAPATFQRTMDTIIKGAEEFAASFLDDLIIFSEIWEDHRKHLVEILSRLKSAGLTANPRKCQFVMQEVSYLGYIVGGGEVKPDGGKVKAVHEFPRLSFPQKAIAMLSTKLSVKH